MLGAPPTLIDATGLGRMLSIPTRTVYALAARGELPHHRVGRAVRFDPAEILTATRHDRSGASDRRASQASGTSLADRMAAIERGRTRAGNGQ